MTIPPSGMVKWSRRDARASERVDVSRPVRSQRIPTRDCNVLLRVRFNARAFVSRARIRTELALAEGG